VTTSRSSAPAEKLISETATDPLPGFCNPLFKGLAGELRDRLTFAGSDLRSVVPHLGRDPKRHSAGTPRGRVVRDRVQSVGP
jgi:hypothetical protein